MKNLNDLYDYQRAAVVFQSTHKQTALWMDMGLGKTVITLSSIAHLLRENYLRGVLVVGTLRICRLVWRQEATKWDHTRHLTFSMLMGPKDVRNRALMRSADVYLINYENLGWLASVLETYFLKKGRPLPFDGVVFDEISKMKNSSTRRVQSLMRVIDKFKWRTGLTGTPASNGYKDLHGQYLVLDGGQRLGTSKTAFENRFYTKDGPYNKKMMPGALDEIQQLIGDVTMQMAAEDYNPLPDLITNDIMLDLDPEVREQYEQLENDYFFMLDSGDSVEVFNKASLTNKCLQFSNGAVYPAPGIPLWQAVHDAKLQALDDILEEAGGQQILLAYAYRSDAARIMERYKKLRPINLTECKSESSLQGAMARWRNGDCPLMIGHPASMGHGIDGLQEAGHIVVWFGLTWSLDLYQQMNARIRRQGLAGNQPVICHRLMVNDTLDQAQALRLESKDSDQVALRKSIGEYRKRRGKLPTTLRKTG